VAIALFTAVLTLASIFQGYILRGQLSVAEKSARPYIVPYAAFNNNWKASTETDILVTVHGINSSAFPATHVKFSKTRIEFGTDATKKAEACELDYTESQPVVIPPVSALPGGNDMANTTVHSEALSDTERKRIQDGVDKLVIFGGIKYSGVNDEDFETRYCWIYFPTGMPMGMCKAAICQSMK